MNMIVTTKEVFQLKKYVHKRKNNVCSGLLLNEESSSSPPPCTRSRLQGIRYLSDSFAMMGVIDHNDDVGNDDADDANDNDANDDDEHKWK